MNKSLKDHKKENWEDKNEYDRSAGYLAKLFIENFLKYDINQSELLNAGPIVSIK